MAAVKLNFLLKLFTEAEKGVPGAFWARSIAAINAHRSNKRTISQVPEHPELEEDGLYAITSLNPMNQPEPLKRRWPMPQQTALPEGYPIPYTHPTPAWLDMRETLRSSSYSQR